MLRENSNQLIGKIKCYYMRARQRRQLSRLDDFMLKDIGISRADAVKESNKHFWER